MSTPITERPWQRADSALLAALLALTAAWIAIKLHWSWTPMEDASMLLRYAQHLAAGHGIRWSLNQAPVDGATDFLYMALIAALSRLLHIGVIPASRALNIAAQLGSVTLLYTGARRLGGLRWLSATATLYLIAGPFTGLATLLRSAGLRLLPARLLGYRPALRTPHAHLEDRHLHGAPRPARRPHPPRRRPHRRPAPHCHSLSHAQQHPHRFFISTGGAAYMDQFSISTGP